MPILIRDSLWLSHRVEVGIGDRLAVGVNNLPNYPLAAYQAVIVACFWPVKRDKGRPALQILILVAVPAISAVPIIIIFFLKSQRVGHSDAIVLPHQRPRWRGSHQLRRSRLGARYKNQSCQMV